jgi:hypothetical protein
VAEISRGRLQDLVRSIQETQEGDCIFVGGSQSSDGDVAANHGGRDYWVVKLGSDLGVDDNELGNSVILFPNPNSGKFSLSFSDEVTISSLKVVDAFGRLIFSETNVPSGNFQIDQNLSTGSCFVNVTSTASEAILKMIVD